MGDIPEKEEIGAEVPEKTKSTRAVRPGGKKRGPKPKPVTKTIRVRVMDEQENPLPPVGEVKKEKTFNETCEYVEITVMPQEGDHPQVSFNNGCNFPITFIRGHKCIIPKPYVDTMDEINAIQLLKHEAIDGARFREYHVPLMKFPYIIHRSGLTYADFKKQQDHYKTLKDPWDMRNSNFGAQ